MLCGRVSFFYFVANAGLAQAGTQALPKSKHFGAPERGFMVSVA